MPSASTGRSLSRGGTSCSTWTGEDPIRQPTKGEWITFAGGTVSTGRGGTVTFALNPSPIPVRYLRIWMTESSNTCDSHGPDDRRNCVGYAISEISLGTQSAGGEFYDLVRHTADQDQTATVCSSIDPWHAPSDIGPTTREQVGLDLFYTSGYTRGLPAMIPIAMLYGTPEDAAAQIAYLKKRGYPISWVEMGEEPDGQYMLPEDYGALYLQFATALHRVDPALKLGGPVFEGVNDDILVWPDARREDVMARALPRLSAGARQAGRPDVHVVRALPVRALPVSSGASCTTSPRSSRTSCRSGGTTGCRRTFRCSSRN